MGDFLLFATGHPDHNHPTQRHIFAGILTYSPVAGDEKNSPLLLRTRRRGRSHVEKVRGIFPILCQWTCSLVRSFVRWCWRRFNKNENMCFCKKRYHSLLALRILNSQSVKFLQCTHILTFGKCPTMMFLDYKSKEDLL